jgi:hypothetical protein
MVMLWKAMDHITVNHPFRYGTKNILKNLKIKMKDRQNGDDDQNDKTAVEQIFQYMSPEEADDDKHDNGS